MVCKKKGEEESIWVQKLKTTRRSWEHNSSHTRHLSSHTPLMFCDFTDKLREWSRMIEPGQACSCNHKLLCSHGARSVKFQSDLSSHALWEQGFILSINEQFNEEKKLKIVRKYDNL